ncbi:hypothetical protein [Paraburkholderia aspalathi]|jgi:hypothetical protein|uniref:Uncharacterized protein n=1 Tax=Paraburkholderia aspalathi TaxID=1324617 RepID=A0A1I7EPG9_9BURK|nr:hypothetical protein [Paraburkholderia aspalathi]MCX4141530.1 hypothetical protein [Paraburkholderia aspalathi]CAE6805870.1 hypothetical protein R69746_05395 [Paraburkholderia aspalathi]CAE6830148.1 hypothetical protein R20943_06595 [Paraburkholderia aspalathi]SFU25828.1 hypothetical protein SAMN05192563_104220 [Paraburkholderia aspalathi]
MKQADELFESMSIVALQSRRKSGGSSSDTERCPGESHDRH